MKKRLSASAIVAMKVEGKDVLVSATATEFGENDLVRFYGLGKLTKPYVEEFEIDFIEPDFEGEWTEEDEKRAGEKIYADPDLSAIVTEALNGEIESEGEDQE